MRSRRPSSPPLTKPSVRGSAISDSTAPLCRASPASLAACLTSACSSRTRPSPSANAAILPSRLNAQAATGASAATERDGGSVVRHSGFPRSSFTSLLQAVFEAALQVLGVEVAADEDQLARALVAFLPRRAPVGVHHHVHALEDVAARRAVDRQDALAAQDVTAAQLQQRAHPFLELIGIDRAIRGEAEARDLVAMVVVVAVCEEIRLELQDALEVEGA